MKQISFYSLKEKTPTHGQDILFIKKNEFYNSYGILYGTVEYSWMEMCDGYWTGLSICYNNEKRAPKNCVLSVMAGDSTLEPDDLWAPADEVEKVLFG